jgi:hypothetical protein
MLDPASNVSSFNDTDLTIGLKTQSPDRWSPHLPTMVSALQASELSSNWSFRQSNDEATHTSWLPVKHVPSTVHQDLIDNKK